MVVAGHVLSERYRLQTIIDDGGASTVWAATEAPSGRRVALKLLTDRVPDLPKHIGSFVDAGRRASKVIHPAFVAVTDIGRTEQGVPFLVMELLENESSLRHHLDQSGPLPIGRAISVMGGVLAALSAAHGTGKTHGDLKPSNIMVPEQRDGGTVRILNLGLSKPMLSDQDATTPVAILGVLDYVAPEHLQRPGADSTPQSDVFACGVIFGEMLMGQLPLAPLKPRDPTIETKLADRNAYYMSGHSVPLPSGIPEMSPQLIELIRTATSVDPAQRFAEAKQMLSALKVLIDADPQMALDRPKFVEVETVVSDPPFDLQAFRAKHPSPAPSDVPPDQRSTMLLSPEESTLESPFEQDTYEFAPLDDAKTERPRPSPFGDPFESNEPDLVDLAPHEESSAELKTKTYRSERPQGGAQGATFSRSVEEVKTEIFEPDEVPQEILDGAPTVQVPLRPTEGSPHSEPRESSTPGQSSRLTLIVALIALFGLVGLGLTALYLWVL